MCGGNAENYFIINWLWILRLFLVAVVVRPLSACTLMLSAIYTRAQESEWISFSILPEPLRKRNVVDSNSAAPLTTVTISVEIHIQGVP